MLRGGWPAGGGAESAPLPQAPPFHGHLSAPWPPALDACGAQGCPAPAWRAAEAESEALRTAVRPESRADEQEERRSRELESLVVETRGGAPASRGGRGREQWDGPESPQALIAELRRREQDSKVRISELEGTLSQVAVLQKQAMAERLQKEQEYLREISRLEHKVAEAQSPGSAVAEAQARAAEVGRREQEHLQQIRKLTEKVEELERAPAIVQTLLVEVAKKDHERLSEIGTLKDALHRARNHVEVCSSASSPATASLQSLLSGAGRVAELEAEVASLRRELSASAAVEGELEQLKGQLKATAFGRRELRQRR
ncbi:unnamed protein product [Prorocentrum cordatum]|uniref:Centrosomal protein of 162 kDa n=1 Tax=Prorocentrum cordatum TaxID=2364126 RepID=A0ABN9QI81_9DINO|nr:unnamed protein product [Polarella glacialis]